MQRLSIIQIAHLYKYLVLGHIIGKYHNLNEALRSEIAGVIGFIGFCVLFLIRVLGYTFPLQDTLLTTLGLGFIYSATCQAIATGHEDKKWIKVLSYLGRISLPIYFIHYFFLPDLTFLRSYEETLSSTPIAQFAFQAILGLATSGIILIPTLLLISITRTNKYLRFLLYGEPLS